MLENVSNLPVTEKVTAARSVFAPFPESRLTRRALRSVSPLPEVEYEFTQDVGLLHQYFLMREAMFISVWGLKNFSGLHDRFDDVSEIMVARRGKQVLAGGRITVSAPSRRQLLPMEGADLSLASAFPDLDLANHTYCEFSRLAILPEFRSGQTFPEVARRFIRRAVAEGVDYAFNMAPVPLARSYRQAMLNFGLKWQVRQDVQVPEREEFEGIKMVLSVMNLTHLRMGSKMLAETRETVDAV